MKKRTILFSTALVLSGLITSPVVALAENYESQIRQNNQTIESNKQQIESNNQALEALKQQQTAQTETLNALLTEINQTEESVTKLKQDIQKTQDQISLLEEEVEYLTEAIAKRDVKIKQQARYIQTDSPGNSLVEAIWSSESIVEAFEKIFAMAELTNASQTTLLQQKADKEAVEVKHQELNKQLAEQGQRANHLQQLMLEQDNRRSELEKTIATIQEQASTTLAENSQLQSQVAQAQSLIVSYQQRAEQARQIAQQSAINEQIVRTSNNVSSSIVASPVSRTTSTASQAPTSAVQTQSSAGESSHASVSTSGGYSYVVGSGGFTAPNSSYIAAVNGGYPGQCTWYIYNRVAQLGAPISYRKMGNGGDWGNYARSYGFSVTNVAKAGRVVSFSSAVPGMSSYGHVAFVESVNADGSIVVSEMNVRGEFVISTRTISASTAARGQYIDVGL